MGAMTAPEPAVTAANAGQEILQCFWDLAAVDEDRRVQAAQSLVECVKAESSSKLPPFSKTDVESISGSSKRLDAILRGCGASTTYAIKRLAKGLASGRAAARQGFSLALTACLEVIPGFGLDRATALLDACLETTGSMKGNEVRDVLLGRTFGLGAIVRSGLVKSSADASAMMEECASIAAKKSFLREAATMVVLELSMKLEEDELKAALEKAPMLTGWLQGEPAASTPEALVLAVRLWGQLPQATAKKCKLLPKGVKPPPQGLFTSSEPLSKAEAAAAAAAAAAFFSEAHLTVLQPVFLASHSSHPRLHLLWPSLMALLIPGFTVRKDRNQAQRSSKASAAGGMAAIGAGQLEALWAIVVESGLFTGTSHERKALGFKLFGLLLPHLRPHHVPSVFSKGFLRCLVSNVIKPDNYLHQAAKRTVDRLVEMVTSKGSDESSSASNSVRMAIITTLQRFGGSGFDKLTKTKTVSRLLQGLDAEELASYISELKAGFLEPQVAVATATKDKEDEQDEDSEQSGKKMSPADAQRIWLVDQMCAATNLPAASAQCKLEVATFLAAAALLAPSGKAKKVPISVGKHKVEMQLKELGTALTREVRQICATRLLSMVGSGVAGPTNKKDGEDAAEKTRLSAGEALEAVVSFLKSAGDKGVAQWTPEMEEEEEEEEAWGAASGLLGQLLDKEAEMGKVLKAGEGGGRPGFAMAQARGLQAVIRHMYLYGRCMVFLQADTPPLEEEVVLDLLACATAAMQYAGKPGATAAGPKDAKASSAWKHEPVFMLEVDKTWSHMLLDCLLLILRQPWDPLPAAPLRDAVEAAFRSFAEGVSWNGFTHLMRVVISEDALEAEGEDEDEDEDIDEDESEDEEEEDEDEEDEDEDEDEDDDNNEGENDEGEVKKADLTKKASKDSDEEDDDDDDLPDMDDEAMFRMDGAVAAHLRALADAKARKKAEAAASLGFRLRVAALLEVLVKRAPGADILPDAAMHLYEALRRAESTIGRSGTAAAVLEARVQKLLRLVCSSRAEASAAGRSYEQCKEEVDGAEAVARHCAKSQHKELLELGQSVVLYLWHVALASARTGDSSEAEEQQCCCSAPGKVVEQAELLLNLFMTNKKCRLKRKFFESAGQIHPGIRMGLLSKASEFATTARSVQLQVDAMAISAALLKVPKASRESLAKSSASDWKAVHGAVDKMIFHGICGDWKSPKTHVEAIKAVASVLRAAKGLQGAQPKAGWLSKGKEKTKVTETSAALFAAGSNRLVGCLRELLALVGVDAKKLQPKKNGKESGKGAKQQGKKRPADDEDSGDDNSSDDEDMVADDLLASDDEDMLGDSDDDDDDEPPSKGKGKAGKKGGKPKKNAQNKKQNKKSRKG